MPFLWLPLAPPASPPTLLHLSFLGPRPSCYPIPWTSYSSWFSVTTFPPIPYAPSYPWAPKPWLPYSPLVPYSLGLFSFLVHFPICPPIPLPFAGSVPLPIHRVSLPQPPPPFPTLSLPAPYPPGLYSSTPLPPSLRWVTFPSGPLSTESLSHGGPCIG